MVIIIKILFEKFQATKGDQNMKSSTYKFKLSRLSKRNIFLFQFIFFFLSSFLFCQSNFQKFLDRVNSTNIISEKQAIVDSFMIFARSVGIPYLEDTTAYFIYINPGLSKINNKSISSKIITLKIYNGVITTAMQNIESTEFYYSPITFLSDTRVDYHFEVDGNKILDPENPSKIIGNSLGEIFSELRMPNYIYPEEIDYIPLIPHGTREKTVLHSDQLQWDFDIEIYLPPSYYINTSKKYPVSYQQDGQNWFKDVMGTVNILDNLTYQNKIEEIILVGIYSYLENRTAFYVGAKKDQYESFIVNQVIPYIESKYRVINDPKSRCIKGVSNGGPISAQIAYNNPNLFGLCILNSPAFNANAVLDSIINGVNKDIKFYVDWGFYESSIRTTSIRFRDNMIAKNYALEWHEWHDGHVYGNLRAHQDNSYTFMFPSENSVGIKEANQKIKDYILFQNYPNPFNPITTIKYSIPLVETKHASTLRIVQLRVYDILGREVATLVNEEKPAGTYEITWNAANLPSGVYFYQLKTGSYTATKKLLLLK